MKAFVLAIGVALLLPAAAWAKPRVAVAPFDGDPSGAVNDLVAELLEGDYAVTGGSQVRRKLDDLGLESDLSEKDLKKLANELDAEAIVRGDVASKSGHKVLHVKLFVHGKRVKGFKVEFVSTRSEKVKSALKDKLLEKLGGSESSGGGDEDKGDKGDKPDKGDKGDGGDDKTDKADKTDKTDKADKTDKGDKGGDDGDEIDGGKKKKHVARGGDDDEEVDDETEVKPIKMSPHTANRAAIRVEFGPSVSQRNLAFTSRAFDQAPKPYANSVVPGGRVAGDIYPLAFGNPDSFAAGIGVGGDFDQTVGLKLRSTAQPGSQFPVKQGHWSVGGRFRIAFGKRATSPTVTLRGGIFRRMFKVDRTELMMGNIIDLPDVSYKGFNPGIDMRFPFVASVALILGGDAYLVTDAGAIQTPGQYGQARVTGGEGYAGLDFVFARRITVKLVGEFSQMGFAFVGGAEMTNNRDGVPGSKDVGGAADRIVGGAMMLGVIY